MFGRLSDEKMVVREAERLLRDPHKSERDEEHSDSSATEQRRRIVIYQAFLSVAYFHPGVPLVPESYLRTDTAPGDEAL